MAKRTKKVRLTPGKLSTKPKTNGNGKYLSGAEAHERNRRIYVLRHFCGVLPKDIAPIVKVTRARVQQILATHEEKLYIVDFAQLQDIQQRSFVEASKPIV